MGKAWVAAERKAGLARYTPEAYAEAMDYVFDPEKDRANRAKHGVSLALAEVLFAGPHRTALDDRFDYGEVREIAFGLVGGRLFVCVYADREGKRRVISLRKANQREVKRYDAELE